MYKILGREPAVFWGLVAGVLLALLQLFPLPDAIAGAANAVVLAATGLATAAMVARDRALPALTGLVQATFALFLALGTPVPDQTQTGILALLAAVGAFFVRQNVEAPIAAGVSPAENEAWHLGHQAGMEAAQDAAVPIVNEPGSGAHALTETFPAVDKE